MPEPGDGPTVERSLRLPGDHRCFGDLVDALDRIGVESACSGEAWREFVTAVIEIGGNILSYAYRESAPGEVDVRIRCSPGQFEAHFRDWGSPFVEPDAPPPDPDDLDAILELSEHGRGLSIARAALDTLEYDRAVTGENHWKLTKHA